MHLRKEKFSSTKATNEKTGKPQLSQTKNKSEIKCFKKGKHIMSLES